MLGTERKTDYMYTDAVDPEVFEYFASIKKLCVPTRLGSRIPIIPRTIAAGYGDLSFEKKSDGTSQRTECSEDERSQLREMVREKLSHLGLKL